MMFKKVFFLVTLTFLIQTTGYSETVIPVTNKNLRSGLSLYNWVCTNDYILTTGCGASVKLGFNNTRKVELQISTDHMKFSCPERFPILAWSVNGGALHTHQLVSGEKAVVLSSDVENPVIDLFVKGMSSYENRYTGDIPENSVIITGFIVDDGGTVLKTKHPHKIWLDIGDSIMSGDAAAYTEGQGRPKDDLWAGSDDSRACYGYLLATHYGYREARMAFGGYNWGRGMAKLPALRVLVDSMTSTNSRLNDGKLKPMPDVVLINLGENGIPDSKEVTDALEKLRSRVNPSTTIMVMIPVSGRANAEISRAFDTYQRSSWDNTIFLIDLGKIDFGTADGQHPTAGGHQSIYKAALPRIDKILK